MIVIKNPKTGLFCMSAAAIFVSGIFKRMYVRYLNVET